MASARHDAALIAAVLLLLLVVSSVSGREVARAPPPALTPADNAAAARVPQGSSVAPAAEAPDIGKNGAARWRRTAAGRRGGRGGGGGGGNGAWAFSAMLPRGFVPPSGSSACHNDMPATVADANFFMCGGEGTP
uniref:Uncharacterized protein n=1 Tax=Leersia perrieri TaxID=77586 RepID=A0A0D9WR00_9ORYZ